MSNVFFKRTQNACWIWFLKIGMNSPERSLAVMELRILSCWSAEASILPPLLEQTEPELSTRPSASSTSRSIKSLQCQKSEQIGTSQRQHYKPIETSKCSSLHQNECMDEKLTLHQDSCWTSSFRTGFVGQRSQTVQTFSTCSKTQHIRPQSSNAPWNKQLRTSSKQQFQCYGLMHSILFLFFFLNMPHCKKMINNSWTRDAQSFRTFIFSLETGKAGGAGVIGRVWGFNTQFIVLI